MILVFHLDSYIFLVSMTGIVSRILMTLTIVLVINSERRVSSAGKCPSVSRVLHPCRCSNDRIIICGEQIKYSLKHIFQDLSNSLSKNDKHFSDFVFENTVIEELEDNLFGDILFENITIINAKSLAKIKSNAFNNTAKSVRHFEQRGPTKLGNWYLNQLFDALSSLVNVRHISLELNSMKSFPSYAFTSENRQSRVESFRLRADSLTQIPNYAFYELHNLKYISLKSDQISRIAAHSFDFEMPSNNIITIDLRGNQLTVSSFELEAFLGTKRPIHLWLQSNNLTHLDEKIFEPLLNSDQRNVIDLEDNPLICNCNMYWLLRDRDVYQSQLINGFCNSLANIWSLDETYFQYCYTNSSYAPNLVIRSMSFQSTDPDFTIALVTIVFGLNFKYFLI